jgi:hypothetical protein
MIKVDYTAVANNNGATILSYELQKSTPLLVNWTSIHGNDPHSLSLTYNVSTGLVKGSDYVFRYRAVNQIGGGPWSNYVTIKAAGKPGAPMRPEYQSSTSNSITLYLNHSLIDNGGAKISSYKVYRDTGNYAGSID